MRSLIAAFALLAPSCAFAQTVEDRLKALETRLGAAPLSTPSNPSLNERAGTTLDRPTPSNQYNPAIGLSLDGLLRGRNGKGTFELRSAELNLESPVDPHLKAWGIINAAPGGVELEEAALQTTSLPGNLTVRGGRLFSAFGRLAHFHEHELPFMDRPNSLETLLDGEARGDGLEVSWLSPLPFYTNLTLGAYNRLGSENERRDDNPRSWDEFTFMGRAHSALEAGDHMLDVGVNSAWTPKRRVAADASVALPAPNDNTTARDTWRALHGVDLTYRWQPAAGGIYRGLTWGTEIYQNDERRFDAATGLPTTRERAYGGYSYAQLKLGRRLRPGVMLDLTEGLDAPNAELTKTYAAFATCDVSEFQKFRLQYTRRSTREPGRRVESTIGLQWAAIIGHHVHGFRDR